jgi:hypothetical protein
MKNGKYVDSKRIERWYKDDKFHREDGPAVIWPDGYQEWYKNGNLHREDGPAIMVLYGTQYWYKDGKLHREDEPAIIRPNGVKIYIKDNYLHNLNGPAVIAKNHGLHNQHFIYGYKISSEHMFNELIKKYESYDTEDMFKFEIHLMFKNERRHKGSDYYFD